MSILHARARLLPDREFLRQSIAVIRASQDFTRCIEHGGMTTPCTLAMLPSTLPVTLDTGSRVDMWLSWDGPFGVCLTGGVATGRIRHGKGDPSIACAAEIHTGTGKLVTSVNIKDRLKAVRLTTDAQRDDLHGRLTMDAAITEWHLLEKLEPLVADAVHRKNLRVGQEVLAGDTPDPDAPWSAVIDSVSEDQIVSKLLFGVEGSKKPSAIRRLVRRIADSTKDQLANVDIATHLVTNIDRDAEAAIRSHIKDPHIGRVIRRFVRTTYPDGVPPDMGLQDLADQYNAHNPGHSVGPERLMSALTAGRQLTVGALAFEERFAKSEEKTA